MNLDWLTGSPWPILALVLGAVALLALAAGAPARMRELKALLDEGLITPAEYEAKKAQILERL